MPKLSEFRDVEEMDNRYIGKCIVYVEGKDDRNVWERIAGVDLVDRLEFKVPLAEGTGSDVVLDRVRSERLDNSKIFGLVDGEVAARFGKVARLIACADVLFDLRSPGCDGILFLSAHEVENVLIGHSDLVAFVESNVKLGEIGSRSREDIERHISKLAKRFYVASLIKYTWAHMYFREFVTKIGNVNHFRSDQPLAEEIRNAKQEIKREFSDNFGEFRQQLAQIGGWAKEQMKTVEAAGVSTDTEIVRLADGKGLLIKLRSRWKFTKADEGLLVDRVRLSDYAKKFQTQLVSMTGA